ncbi:hypothetical protein JCM10908_006846 [Rhodotorula pacifica]|uniref:uncharacterized protein n=1 Tax=Rhodotorula pacifica TaxID=1495444 RepID=UPI0031764299
MSSSSPRRADHYYIPLANSPSVAQSPFLDSSSLEEDQPHPSWRKPPLGLSHSTRSSLSRRAILFAGLVSLLVLVVVSAVRERQHISRGVDQVVMKGQEAVGALWDAGVEIGLSAGFEAGGGGGQELEGGGSGDGDGALPLAGEDFIASQAISSPVAEQAVEGVETIPGDPGILDHEVLDIPPAAAANGNELCPPEMRARANQHAFWITKQVDSLSYSISPRESPADLLPPPPSCLAHAVFSARLVSLAVSSTADEPVVLDPPETQTLFALERPTWQAASNSYALTSPPLPALPRKRYKLDVRLEFGYYPGLVEGSPCGLEERRCEPEGIVAMDGREKLRYLGEEIEVLGGGIHELGEASPAATPPTCTGLSSLTGYWSNLSYHPASPACSLAIPTLPLPDALFAAASSSTGPNTAAPIWINIVGDSNSRNTYKRLIASLGGGFHASGPTVMDSKTHNGTLAGLAFRYREGVPPSDETKQVPDVIVTWMWWYQMAPSPALLIGSSEIDPAIRENRDELLSFVDTDLAGFVTTARLASVHKHFPLLGEAARGLRPYRTYLSLGSHGEELSLPGMASSLHAFLSETGGLSRAKRDASNLRLMTTTFVNAHHIPLARFPHQDLIRTNALIHAKNVYTSHERPEFAQEGRVLDVEALTRGIVEQDEWMKQGKKKKSGPDAVHFRKEVYDELVRVLWTDLMAGLGDGSKEGSPASAEEEAHKRWKRILPPLLDDEEPEL